jgi:predicted nucleic acid-binding Zn ribbon protein
MAEYDDRGLLQAIHSLDLKFTEARGEVQAKFIEVDDLRVAVEELRKGQEEDDKRLRNLEMRAYAVMLIIGIMAWLATNASEYIHLGEH